jgi:hypothetical protein
LNKSIPHTIRSYSTYDRIYSCFYIVSCCVMSKSYTVEFHVVPIFKRKTRHGTIKARIQSCVVPCRIVVLCRARTVSFRTVSNHNRNIFRTLETLSPLLCPLSDVFTFVALTDLVRMKGIHSTFFFKILLLYILIYIYH